jgi:uncharacterized cupredoxin-like copper-binding protein
VWSRLVAWATSLAFIVAVALRIDPILAKPTDSKLTDVPTVVEIAIKARQFYPSVVKLFAGRDVRLVFRNKDAELHAFVPIMFLDNLPLHVEGNGAPQFDQTGLKRVLIPSGGRAEIWFAPPSAGLFTYRCDLPGHQMVGQILVE